MTGPSVSDLAFLQDDHAWLGTGPIPAAPFYDPVWFDLEREAVFKRTWLQVGHVCEIPEPGNFVVRKIDIAGVSVLIARGKDGTIHAHHNVCTHRGTELVDEPSGKRPVFTCPYHSWTFGTDGRLISAPDFEQFYVNKSDCNLKRISVDVCAGLVFVNLDPSPAQSLNDFLGAVAVELENAMVGRATCFTEYHLEIDANWKLYSDNFCENYHLRFIHPQSADAALGPENPFGYPVSYAFHGPHRTQTLWKNPDPNPIPADQARAFGEAAKRAALKSEGHPPAKKLDYKVFPNMFVIGQAAYFFTHTIMPVAPDKTYGIVRIYWIGDDDSAAERWERETIAATLRAIHDEDRSIIEAGSRGLKSGALDHVHFQKHEVMCRHLHMTLHRMIETYQSEVKGL